MRYEVSSSSPHELLIHLQNENICIYPKIVEISNAHLTAVTVATKKKNKNENRYMYDIDAMTFVH